jgi:titin
VRFQGAVESIEPRVLLSGMTFDVVTVADSGPGSLRTAIAEANLNPGSTIDFQIEQGPKTIDVLKPLPVITAPVLIDGTSQPGYSGTPLVTVNSQIATAPSSGFVFVNGSQGSVIQGLAVTGFGIAAVVVEGASNITIGGSATGTGNNLYSNLGEGVLITGTGASGNVVEGNVIGLDASAERPLANGNGVEINSGASENTIGGTAANARNVISGNATDGVLIAGAGTSANTVEGNNIGTDGTAMKALGNETGVEIDSGAAANVIGGSVAAALNVISGNANDGVFISGAGTSDNLVEGDYIGICNCASGPAALGNETGVELSAGATANTIGGSAPASRNIISGNFADGILIDGSGTASNTVADNFIGTAISGMTPLPNQTGVDINSGARANTIGGDVVADRNVISGNTGDGVLISGLGTSGNIVEGDYIGICNCTSGIAALGNENGVELSTGATANLIGGSGAAARDVISGNLADGVLLSGLGTSNNTVSADLIGTDPSGQIPVGNATGVEINSGATANAIGGSAGRNVISGNTLDGLLILGSGTTDNIIAANYIGSDISGATALGNGNGVEIGTGASGVTIGETGAAPNVISGNTTAGVLVSSPEASHNNIENNYIGTDSSGQLPLGNNIGVLVTGGLATTIGGTASGAGNVVSGNVIAGIEVTGASATATQIVGNLIGTNSTGTRAVVRTGQSNQLQALQNAGIAIISSGGNLIGGNSPAARNVISGNYVGVNLALISPAGSPNTVLGNLIGTDASGQKPLGNIVGIYINGAAGDDVGGAATGSANVISANTSVGVEILGSGSTGNLIEGNLIGPRADGASAFRGPGGVPIQNVGVFIQDASRNAIGGPSSGAGNVISGNDSTGILILSLSGVSQGNTIESNSIGLTRNGMPTLGNAGYGIALDHSRNNTIVLTGASANHFGRNGIANVRIYQGPVRFSPVAAKTSARRSQAATRAAARAGKH